MKTYFNTHFGKKLALLSLALCVLVPAQAGKLIKWVDENGMTQYGDHVPASASKLSNKTLNERGLVVENKAAAKTPEQFAEEQRLSEIQLEKARLKQQKAHMDRILLDTFITEDDMILTRDGKIEAVEAGIRITSSRIEKAQVRLQRQKKIAANQERAGRPVPTQLKDGITDTRKHIKKMQQYIKKKKLEQTVIYGTFEKDIQRFRELKITDASKK